MENKAINTQLTPRELEERNLAKFEPGSRIGVVTRVFYLKDATSGLRVMTIGDQIELVN